MEGLLSTGPTPSSLHMVRNHRDGYPYLNLSLFFVLKIFRDLNFFGSFKKLDKVGELVGGGSVINGAYPV